MCMDPRRVPAFAPQDNARLVDEEGAIDLPGSGFQEDGPPETVRIQGRWATRQRVAWIRLDWSPVPGSRVTTTGTVRPPGWPGSG